jgi:hypothetical protein
VSVQYDPARARFMVRWREDGRQRMRRFVDEAEAEAFDAGVNPAGRAAQRARASRTSIEARVDKIDARRETKTRHEGVYPYATSNEVRWRVAYRQSDGSLSSRRGFTSRGAAVTARRSSRSPSTEARSRSAVSASARSGSASAQSAART